MISDPEIRTLFESPLLKREYSVCDHPDFPAALPDASLEFLLALAQELKVKDVFEFGSGRSTQAFLEAGYSVTSLEDSSHWMRETVGRVSESDKLRHVPVVRPLRLRWQGLFPVMDWPIDHELARAIGAADLILVDSPYFPPFREATLWSALLHNDHAVIVLDDTRIPTLSRFCDRIARENPQLLHRRVSVGHCFDLFARVHSADHWARGQSVVEIFKGWRRFIVAMKQWAAAPASVDL